MEADTLSLSGELDHFNGDELLRWLAVAPAIGVLCLDELDIVDGVAATHALNAVRQLSAQVAKLRIVGAPQVLGHNLYRTGMLDQGRLELVAMREDEAYG